MHYIYILISIFVNYYILYRYRVWYLSIFIFMCSPTDSVTLLGFFYLIVLFQHLLAVKFFFFMFKYTRSVYIFFIVFPMLYNFCRVSV